uniref:Glycosyltransferase n=1 Tax=Centella asiatica TaxID=48106 RepID=A0A172ELW1_CENAS|nr:UDP-glucosyltransferase [Centella asiatica]WJY55136.1 UDP-glucosyltransferase [Centella asiatica]
MVTNSKDNNALRILMFPWLGHGHISPYLELAKKLSRKDSKIYFCSTPINLKPIKNKILDYNSIELIEFPLPSSQELPPHYHTTTGLPPHLLPALKDAFEMASPQLSNILDTITPDLLIYDIYQPWVPKLASSYKIPAVHFQTTGATAISYFYRLSMNLKTAFPSTIIHLKDIELVRMLETGGGDESDPENEQDRDRVFDSILGSVEILLIKSSREIEGKYIDCLSDFIKKKIVSVGPLVQEFVGNDQENDDVITWLSKKEPFSTVYVSFGTESFLSKKDLEELAHGLELSGVNFIWALKFPEAEKITKVEEALPQGFLERVGEKGLVLGGWVPQAKILNHSSIGGFVSHCGWSSVIESLSFGVPIIAMPLQNDQPLNARLVVEVGVGLEVEKDDKLEFGREEVARVVKEVVVEEKSRETFGKRVKELSEVLKVKADEDVDNAIKELKRLCENNLRKVE